MFYVNLVYRVVAIMRGDSVRHLGVIPRKLMLYGVVI